MLVDEAVRLLVVKKVQEVVLTLRKKDGSIKEVKMIREEVAIEDTFARSIIVNSPNGKNMDLSIYLDLMQILKMQKVEMLLMTSKLS